MPFFRVPRGKMVSGIYCIENKINGKKYVGQGLTVEKRMNDPHRECKVLYSALEKYGRENFIRYILEFCEESILDERETFYIKKLESHVTENGYNVLWGGFTRRGVSHSLETIKKLSLSHSNISDETRQKMRDRQIGRKHSEETKAKIGNAHRGIKHSQESIEKSKRVGEEHFMFGKKHSEETISKMREKSSGKNNSQYGEKYERSSSKYFGVNWNKNGKSWKSTSNGKKEKLHVGYYKIEKHAAIARDIGIIFLFGDNEYILNFPYRRSEYAFHLLKYEISTIEDLRKVIKIFLEERS